MAMYVDGEGQRMAERLRQARGSRSAASVAARAQITEEALAAYEAGKRRPRDEVKLRLAKTLHCSIGYLFFNENDTICDLSSEDGRCPWCGHAAAYFYLRGNEVAGCDRCTVTAEPYELAERG